MATLKRLRKQAAYNSLAKKGFNIVTHSRTKLELELLFQIALNKLAKATGSDEQHAYWQISAMLQYYNKTNHTNLTRGKISKDIDCSPSMSVGSMLHDNHADNDNALSIADTHPTQDDNDIRSNTQETPVPPTHNEQD